MAEPESDAQDGHSKKDLAKGLREKSLKAAGTSFFVADTALLISGYLTDSYALARAGMFGLTAGAIGNHFGNPSAEKQLELIERRMGAYLREHKVEIPQDPSIEALTRKGGPIDHLSDFVYEHPAQVMNMLYSMVGVEFARFGLDKKNDSPTMVASGALLIAGALSGLLIKEKHPDPEHPPEGVLQKAWSWVQEKPLRVTGTLFTANQVMFAKSVIDGYQKNPSDKTHLFKFIAVAGFTFGNIMMTLSSKAHENDAKLDKYGLDELAEVSARVIAAQPPEVQKALLTDVANHLATEHSVHMTAEQIGAMLEKKLHELAPAQPVAGWQARVGTTPGDAQLQH